MVSSFLLLGLDGACPGISEDAIDKEPMREIGCAESLWDAFPVSRDFGGARARPTGQILRLLPFADWFQTPESPDTV